MITNKAKGCHLSRFHTQSTDIRVHFLRIKDPDQPLMYQFVPTAMIAE